MALRRLGKDAGGEVFSVTFPGQSEPEGLIASTPHSLELAVSVPLPDGFELARAQPTTERVLQLLGALNLGLQSRGWQVSPVAHLRGLEAVALSRHLCRELVSAELLRDELLALHAAARRVFEALSEPASRLFVAVRKASGVRHVAPRRQLHRRTPALIPTFDGAATELMLKAARRRQRKGEPQRHRDTETER